MSIVTKRVVHELPATNTESLKGFADKSRAEIKALDINHSPQKTVTVVTLDDSTELEDTINFESDLRHSRKRRRLSNSSSESFEERSCSASPEISYGGSPVIYKLREKEGRVFIVKVPMSSKQRGRRSQQCTDQDITSMLDSEEDEDLTIFDSGARRGGRVVATLQNEDKFIEFPQTPKRSKKHVDSSNSAQNSPSRTPSRSKTLQNEEVSLKLKLRRSTEQSNYKIAVDQNEEKTRRSSSRSNVGTPKKCRLGCCDEDHDLHINTSKTPQKTPNKSNVLKESAGMTPAPRRTRKNSKTVEFNSDMLEIKSLHNKENESEVDNNMEEDNDSISSRGRSTRAKSRSTTPQPQGNKLKDTPTGTPRKNSRKLKEANTPSRKYLDTADIIEDFDSDSTSVSSRDRNTRKEEFGTPQKQISKATPSTPSSSRPRRNSRTVYYNTDLLPDDLRDLDNIDEDNNEVEKRGRSGRRSAITVQGTATPQKQRKVLEETAKKTPRKSAVQNIDQVATPKRTPRKSTSQMLDESNAMSSTKPPTILEDDELYIPSSATPKRTPRKPVRLLEEVEAFTPKRTTKKSVKLLENDEPMTPKRISRRPAKLLENDEPMTPKRTPRKPAKLLEDNEPMTPKRTPRKPAKLLEDNEPMTPKRTPRKPAKLLDDDEPMTPKKTPRKPARLLEDDEPMTPNAAMKRRNTKAVTPSVKHGNLTPSMSRRTANVGRPKTILEEARAQLHVSTVPKSLPCRDDEFNDIFRFLESKLLDKSSGCIYISGVPGTGKTATVTEAIRGLKKCVAKGELDTFNFVEINGMKLSEPRQAYVQILKQINGQTHTWEQAHGILENHFKKSSAKRPMTLLLVDELDLLCNKRQDVVYNLLDWPATRNAQLVVITIANTMDLPERILMSRVTSRLGLTRLTFQPYTFKQLQEIVTARLKDSDAFKSEAIQLVARKVAAVSGDARRALDICRRATEITEVKGDTMVTMLHVNEALQEMMAGPKVRAITMCSEMEKYFLRAVDAEVTRTGVEEVVFQDIYRQLTTICSFEGVKTPNVTQALSICSRLGAHRLLLCEQTKNDSQRRIILNVSSDDIHFAMNIANS